LNSAHTGKTKNSFKKKGCSTNILFTACRVLRKPLTPMGDPFKLVAVSQTVQFTDISRRFNRAAIRFNVIVASCRNQYCKNPVASFRQERRIYPAGC
jgi:hypothetical protein